MLALHHTSHPSAIDPRPVEAVTARFAAIGELASSRERVLVADVAHGGVEPAMVQAFARDGVAAVVVTGRDGAAWTMRVGREGEVSPVTVAR